ncbi:hypothetical protein BKH46_03855 [Helicobacter sp. 12S02634-8]|nr:hypothetical protein BKH46_03855 [Helicobacter sp. 12S02634-8]
MRAWSLEDRADFLPLPSLFFYSPPLSICSPPPFFSFPASSFFASKIAMDIKPYRLFYFCYLIGICLNFLSLKILYKPIFYYFKLHLSILDIY